MTVGETGEDQWPRPSVELDEAKARLLRAVRAQGVSDPDVLEALRQVPRHVLVPEHSAECAYQDRPLPIGSEQTISQPTVVGLMSQWAIAGASDQQRRRVLEVGTGSGYQAAILAHLFQEVVSIEVRPELAKRARESLSRLGDQMERIRFLSGDGGQGSPEHAPYDAIVVTAAADHVPPALVDQLAPNGRLVIPISNGDKHQLLHLFRLKNESSGKTLETVHTLPVLFVPLVSGPAE